MDKLNFLNEGNIVKVKSRILVCFSYIIVYGYGWVVIVIGELWLRKWFWLLVCVVVYGVFIY